MLLPMPPMLTASSPARSPPPQLSTMMGALSALLKPDQHGLCTLPLWGEAFMEMPGGCSFGLAATTDATPDSLH